MAHTKSREATRMRCFSAFPFDYTLLIYRSNKDCLSLLCFSQNVPSANLALIFSVYFLQKGGSAKGAESIIAWRLI
jgi:hypothetical protein